MIELFDIAFKKLNVGLGIAELLAVVILMGAGNRQLLRSHIHAHHIAGLANQRRQGVDIPPATTTQIQNAHAFQCSRSYQPTPVVSTQHLRVQFGKHGFEPLGRRDIATGVSLKIIARLQLLAVIGFYFV